MGRQEQKNLTRAKIMIYAKSLFIEKGIAATTMDDIASHAGVSHGTVFFHFKSREALIEEIIDEALRPRLESLLLATIDNHDISVYLNGYFDIMEEEQDAFSMMAREIPLLPASIRSILEDREGQIIAAFMAVYERGVARKVYRKIDADILTAMIFGAIHHFLRFNHRFHKTGKSIHAVRERFLIALTQTLTL